MSAGTAKRKRGKRAPAQSRGLVPQSLKGGAGNNGEVLDLLTRISALWYPGVDNLEQLDPKEQKLWIRFREAAIRGHHSLAELMKTLNEAIRLQVEAEREDLKERREAHHENQKERRRAELEEKKDRLADDLEDRRQRREERGTRLEQEIKERKLVMAMTATSFLVTILLVVIGVVADLNVALGFSGLTGLGSVAGAYRLFVFAPTKSGDD